MNMAPTFSLSDDAITVDQDFANTVTVTSTIDSIPPHEKNQKIVYSISPSNSSIISVELDTLNGNIKLTSKAGQSGTVTFTITANDNISTASKTLTVVVKPKVTTSIDANDIRKLYSFYPNPSSGIFNLELSHNGKAEISILTIHGKIVYNNSIGLGQCVIDLGEVSPGLYILNIRIGNSIVTEKIILE